MVARPRQVAQEWVAQFHFAGDATGQAVQPPRVIGGKPRAWLGRQHAHRSQRETLRGEDRRPRVNRILESPTTKGLSLNRETRLAPGTTSGSDWRIAWLQKAQERGVSGMERPKRDFNHCRLSSISVISRPNRYWAGLATRSSASSGAVSRMSSDRGTARRRDSVSNMSSYAVFAIGVSRPIEPRTPLINQFPGGSEQFSKNQINVILSHRPRANPTDGAGRSWISNRRWCFCNDVPCCLYVGRRKRGRTAPERRRWSGTGSTGAKSGSLVFPET